MDTGIPLPSLLRLVISGGQLGVQQGGLRAARACGIPTGGVAPRGWLTEAGPMHELLAGFDLVECETDGYPARTVANVGRCDGIVWVGDWMSPGGKLTLDTARRLNKPFILVHQRITKPSDVAAWIREHQVEVLLIAGNRESNAPGIGDRTEAFIRRVFHQLGPPALP